MKHCIKHPLLKVSVLLALGSISSCILLSQNADPDAQVSSPISDEHILGIIPNYETVSDPHKPVSALTVRQKFNLFAKETFDPFTPASAAAGAAISQSDNDDPKYGYGEQRVRAALRRGSSGHHLAELLFGRFAGVAATRRSALFSDWAGVSFLASRRSRGRSCCGHTHGLGKSDVQLRGHSRHEHGNWVVQRLLSRGQRECGRSSKAFWHQFGGLGAIQYLARILAGYSAEDFSPQRRLGAAKLGPAGSNRTHLLLARKCGGVPTTAQGFDQIDSRQHAPLQD